MGKGDLWKALIPPVAFMVEAWLALLLLNFPNGAWTNLWRRLGFVALPPVALILPLAA